MWRSTKIFHWQAVNVLTSCDASFRIQGIISTEIAKLARVTDGAQTAAYARRGSDLAARAQVGHDVGPVQPAVWLYASLFRFWFWARKRLLKIPWNETENRGLRTKNFELSAMSGWSDSPVRTGSYVTAGCVQFRCFSLTRCCHTRHDALFLKVLLLVLLCRLWMRSGPQVHRYFRRQGLKKTKRVSTQCALWASVNRRQI